MRDVKSKMSLYGYSDSKMKTRVSANLLCEGGRGPRDTGGRG